MPLNPVRLGHSGPANPHRPIPETPVRLGHSGPGDRRSYSIQDPHRPMPDTSPEATPPGDPSTGHASPGWVLALIIVLANIFVWFVL